MSIYAYIYYIYSVVLRCITAKQFTRMLASICNTFNITYSNSLINSVDLVSCGGEKTPLRKRITITFTPLKFFPQFSTKYILVSIPQLVTTKFPALYSLFTKTSAKFFSKKASYIFAS